MTSSLKRCLLAAILTMIPAIALARKPKPLPDHWIATWATANVAMPVAATPAGPVEYIPGAADTTLRQIVHTSIPTGTTPLVRLEFSNALGTNPLTLGEVHIALADPKTANPPSGDISLFTANALTFNGASSVTIPAGGETISDPVAMTLPTGADLVISIFVPAQKITVATFHPDAWQTNFFAPGNVVSHRSLSMPPTQARVTTHWWFLRSVDVQEPAAASTIVAFGDSTTSGDGSLPNTNHRWPDLLAKRIADQAEAQARAALGGHSAAKPAAVPVQTLAVVNEAISGNRVLRDDYGPSARSRFDRDVLTVPGVSSVILLEGVNDIGNATDPANPHDPVTAAELIDALSQLAARAHARGLKVFGATITPYAGADYASPAGDAIRQQLNTWIRTTHVFDGMIDFDKVTANPAKPAALNPPYDSGDHLHPSNAGDQAMADAIDLRLFGR